MKSVMASCVRTPVHFARQEALAQTRPETLPAAELRGAIVRSGLDPMWLEAV